MDEPLSNLDAKLRVQMRSEISRIQRDLGVTTIYVTHDQVEAMTMGDRVAVMRSGELQQLDAPQTLYDRPVNLFVAGFIGSPAMNLLDARLEADGRRVRRPVRQQPPPGTRRGRSPPARSSSATRAPGSSSASVPRTWRTPSLVSDAPSDRRLSVTVDLGRHSAPRSSSTSPSTRRRRRPITRRTWPATSASRRSSRSSGRRRAGLHGRRPAQPPHRRPGRGGSSSWSTPTACTSSTPTTGGDLRRPRPAR